jgi:membrane associated rhomboid family serine protease
MVAAGAASASDGRAFGGGRHELNGQNRNYEPMFNLPPAVSIFIFLSAAIFIGQTYYLGGEGRIQFVETFCFTPLRYQFLAAGNAVPGGWFAAVWSPFTYVFINRSLSNLVFDMFWLMAFGSTVAYRLGTLRFVGLSIVAALVGAGLFWLIGGQPGKVLFGPGFVVGAHLGAAVRFIYAQDFSDLLAPQRSRWDGPALGLIEMWSNVRVLQLFGFIFAANALFSILYASNGIDGRELLLNVLANFTGMILLSFFDRRPH